MKRRNTFSKKKQLTLVGVEIGVFFAGATFDVVGCFGGRPTLAEAAPDFGIFGGSSSSDNSKSDSAKFFRGAFVRDDTLFGFSSSTLVLLVRFGVLETLPERFFGERSSWDSSL